MLLSPRRVTAAFSVLFLGFLTTPAHAQDSYADPAGSGVVVSAVNWLQDTLMGTVATVVAVIAAAAGVLVAIRIPRIDPLMGIIVGLKAFVAAVLGGIGNIPGAMLGGLLIGITENLAGGYVGSGMKEVAGFAMIIVVLMIRPFGIFGERDIERV